MSQTGLYPSPASVDQADYVLAPAGSDGLPLETVRIDPARRGFLRTAGALLTGSVAAVIAVVTGRAAVEPGLVERSPLWIRAGRLDDLETNVPTPVTLRITRRDGYLETVDEQVVFLVRPADGQVRAMSSSCSHLGCSVTFSRDKQQFLCPCHGGAFNLDGTVAAGPSSKPLAALTARVENSRVLVQV